MDDNMDMNKEKEEETPMADGGMMPEGSEMPADGTEKKEEDTEAM